MFHIPVPRSGITYHPLLEWRLAAHWDGYKWEEFEELDGEAQSMILATYRCAMQIDAVIAYIQWKKSRKVSK